MHRGLNIAILTNLLFNFLMASLSSVADVYFNFSCFGLPMRGTPDFWACEDSVVPDNYYLYHFAYASLLHDRVVCFYKRTANSNTQDGNSISDDQNANSMTCSHIGTRFQVTGPHWVNGRCDAGAWICTYSFEHD